MHMHLHEYMHLDMSAPTYAAVQSLQERSR